MRGDFAPRGEAGTDFTRALTSRIRSSGPDLADAEAGTVIAATLDAHYGDKWGLDNQHVDAGCPNFVLSIACANASIVPGQSPSVMSNHGPPIAFTQNQCGDVLTGAVAPSIGTNSNATGRNTAKVCYAIQERSDGESSGPIGKGYRDDGKAFTLEARHRTQSVAVCAVQENVRGELRENTTAYSISCGGGKPGQGTPVIRDNTIIRRLTPTECEALMGVPRGYTLVPHKGKPMADGPRYRMLGNSMAVPVVRWIGERIAATGQ